MNRVLSRATKLSKIIGKANFFTKINNPMSLIALQASSRLINTPKMNFAESERKFEKFSDSSTGSIRQGKHNIRANLGTERIMAILDFIESNAQAFNDGDYFDSMYLVAQKLDNESNKINMRRPGLKLLNDYVITNFQKTSNSMSNTYLAYLSALSARDIKLLNREQTQNFVQKNQAFLEKSHATMPLFPLINSISMLGLIANINPVQLIKGREGELSGMSLSQLLRIAKRLAVPNQANIVRSVVGRFLANELLNKATNEKTLQKARILNVFCKLDYLDPLLNFNSKIRTLIKMITNEMDQMDSATILPVVDAMVYWDDHSKIDFLKEINDLVSTTITHSADSIYPDFFVRYLEAFSKIKSDSGLSADHLRTFFDFYLKNKKPEEIKNARNLVCFFLVMRKCKFFEKEYIEQFFDITLNQIPFIQIDENLIAYRSLITNHLGETHLQKLREVIKSDSTKGLSDTSKQGNVVLMFNNFAKLCFFDCDKEIVEEAFKQVITALAAADPKNFSRILSSYVDKVQDFIKPHFRDAIVAEILNKIDPKAENQAHARLYIYINECLVSRENEELKKKIQTYTSALSEHEQFKNGFMRMFESLTHQNDGTTPITNLSFSRYINLLKDSIKDEAFIVNKDKSIILNILQTTFNIIKLNKQDSKISEDLLNSFLRVGNDIVTKYPNTLMTINIQRLANFFKAFTSEDLESPLFEKLSMTTLKALPNERLEKDLNLDMIVLLDKLSKGERGNAEKNELIKKIIGSEEKLKITLETSNLSTQIYKMLTQLNKIDTAIISDGLISYGKDLLMKKLKDDNFNTNNKLNVIYALSNAKTNLFTENDLKDLGQDIQNIFLEFSARRLIRTLINAPNNVSRGTISRLIHMKYANLYEKEENPYKQLAIKTLDRYTSIKWPFISLYNKFIVDYGNLFDKFISIEHVNIISYFSRVNIAREDIITTACNAINIPQLYEIDKLVLLKSLTRLGLYKGEAKNAIVETLLSGIDHSFVIKKQGIIGKIQLLFYGWKLSQNGYDSKAMIDSILENLTKINVDRIFDAKRRYSYDNISYFLLNSYLAPNLDENTIKYLTTMFQQRKNLTVTKFAPKVLINYLRVMKHTVQESTESNLVDVFLPESKIGILFIDNNCVNIFDKKPSDDYTFIIEELLKKDITPIVINISEITKHFYESNKNHEAFIEIIEKNFNIPNNNAEKKYDFAALENNLNLKPDNVDEE